MQPREARQWGLAALRRHYTDPHHLYDALRAHDSIYFDPIGQCWLATGYDPVVAILGDARFSSDLGLGASSPAQTPAAPFLHSAVIRQLVFMDGAAHQQAQMVILRPLAQLVRRMPADIRALASMLLDSVRSNGEFDLVRDFAAPISLRVIAQVLGLPADDPEELLQLEQWSDTFGNITSGYLRGDMEDINRLTAYFRRVIAAKRRAPGDDLISALIAADNIFPEDDDLVANCIMIFGAGRATTKKLLGNGVPLLMPQWSVWRDRLREQAALPRLLSEELLRMITPTRYLIRQATEDVDLSEQFPGDHRVRRGEKIFLFLEAANRDPASFAHPEMFDPQRRPNRHIAFGFGPHQCPGATLARQEIQIALEVLLTLPGLQPRPHTAPIWNPNPNLGGYMSYAALASDAAAAGRGPL